MSTITLQLALPESVAAFLEQQVADGAFPDVNAFVAALIQEAQQRQGADEFDALLMDGYVAGDPAAHRETRIQHLRSLIDPAIVQMDCGESLPADEVFGELEKQLRTQE